MPFQRCYYHVIWTTQGRAPWLTSEIEKLVFEIIHRKSGELKSKIYAINGTSDHIHVAVSISLSVAAADWVKQAKGLSAHEINRIFPNLENIFKWQGSYGILTFGAKNLPFVVEYIERQKEHHHARTIDDYLEETEELD
jgi:putative transposase